MLVGGVIDDQIDDDAHAALRGTLGEFDKIAQRAIAWIDVVVVRDVVAAIAIRGGLERHQPDRRDAQAMQIVEAPREALKVSNAVAVRIHEGRDRETVDDSVLVPEVVDHAWRRA